MTAGLRRRTCAAALCALLTAGCGAGMELDRRYPVVPQPRAIAPQDGEFRLDGRTRVLLSDPADEELRALAGFLLEPLRRASGLPLPVALEPAPIDGAAANSITLAVRPPPDDAPAEAYRLSVTESVVELSAATHAGLFRGVQTLLQLLPPAVEDGVELPPRGPRASSPATAANGTSAAADGSRAGAAPAAGRDALASAWRAAAPSSSETTWTIPAVRIDDSPRFRYRGMHLDVGRHFSPVEFVKRYIDLLARYKLNTFHWHLTEDQGWRIEIERYPRLTEVGSCRSDTALRPPGEEHVGTGEPYCGHYTQDEVREVVAYAAERYITVIPEIEMPGHSRAALAAYPELACTDGPFEVGIRWGIYEDIYCPTEETFAFLEGVLTEVMGLFPSRYIHIGGDEAPKKAWEESAEAQAVIRREGLADEDELQSWFIERIGRFLEDHGRRLIGWDEILEGGLPEGATVMSWRGTEGGIEAARAGHDVIMAPTSHVYFDYYQGDPAGEPFAIGGFLPLDTVYAFEPVPEELTDAEARHVLGAQGNVWTEYMRTPGHIEYMAFPRMLALAEVVWSPRDARDRDRFLARLRAQLLRLERLGVNYRVPEALERMARERAPAGGAEQ